MRLTKVFFNLLTILSFILLFSISLNAQSEKVQLNNNKINTDKTLSTEGRECQSKYTQHTTKSTTTSTQKRTSFTNRKSYKSRIARKRKTTTTAPTVTAEK